MGKAFLISSSSPYAFKILLALLLYQVGEKVSDRPFDLGNGF